MVISTFLKSEIRPLQTSVLEDLVQDGLVSENDHAFTVSLDQVLKINDIDRKALEIPLSVPYLIYVFSKGSLNESDFRFQWDFRKKEDQKPVLFKISNHLISIEGSNYIVNHFQYTAINILKKHEESAENDFNNNLELLGKLKSLSQLDEDSKIIIFDKYLTHENVLVAQDIRLDIKENSDGSVNILPSVNDDSDVSFQKAFDIFPKVKSLYNAQVGDTRVRILIPEAKQENLQVLKKDYRKIEGELKDRVLKNPQEFFDDRVFDLDFYSKRVYELGYYEPKFYPFIKPFSTDWVNGITIEEASGERHELLVENEKDFNDLNDSLKNIEDSNIDKIEFKGKQIPVQNAISLRDSYIAIKEKRIDKNGFRDSQGRKVLIIHENIDEVAFQDNKLSEIEHVLEHPKRLKSDIKIMDHQKEGIAWLQSLSKSSSGALLADDMGLGKTLQVLSFLDWTIDYQTSIGTNKPNLIVAPVTLLENWENEQQKFFNSSTRVIRYFGKEAKWIDLDDLDKYDIILSTYETLRSKQIMIAKVPWFAAVLDEAQRIKTPGTMVTNAAKALNVEFKVAMTGTPVENSWMDLWCITDFIASGLLGSAKDFNKKYNQSLKDEDTNIKELGDDIRSQLGIFIKRRLKSQILKDLPKKDSFFLQRLMPTIQEAEYHNELEAYKSNKSKKNQILSTINRLRMISDHPYLLTADQSFMDFSTEDLINSSAKLLETVKIVEDIRSKSEKVILFSHFEKVQKILQKVILEFFDLPVNVINGQTATVDSLGKMSRQKLIDKFQIKEGFNVIIMSPIAAGYGLNVTGANHVIHYTRHWNPAKENQATDRVYRIGQEKPVSIYYPMAIMSDRETFDQKLDSLLKMKNQLSDASLYPSDACEVKLWEFEDLLG
ncbi:DEAD/DEAH box helicase [Belliella sp. DSM 107340]|uniref:DEAD/DEAH box helicase n=1 Tax=Belliella calami TaxID=2923436 RepID=A0ABS9UJX7_9BACT|nr:DEAD/DEAH box helicase [Belliella calami]MCH7396735.1 DEAD/DEAH box helicase [Belliella calami]